MYMSRVANFRPARVNNGSAPLSDDELRQFAPSIFAVEPHESRSARFAHIPTFEVLAGLRKEGFVPVKVAQGRSRVPGKADFTKHMVRFRHVSTGDTQNRYVGQVSRETVLVNAHDGTSAYHLMAGLFRLECLNGMVSQLANHGELHIPHKGNVVDRVIEGSYTVLDDSALALDAAERWSGVALSRPEQMLLADGARTVRLGDTEGKVDSPIQADAFLVPRRRTDASPDLWTTFNRIQENSIRGGLSAIGRDANNRRRTTTTREIKGIDQDVKLNRALWSLAAKMAELKGA